jgi:hypothetical protein
MNYSFRNPEKSAQLQLLHPKCYGIFTVCVEIINAWGYAVEITSMIRPKDTVKGESGVHATGRAIDFIPVPRSKYQTMIDEEIKLLVDFVNKAFHRMDGKMTLMWHSVVGGGGKHFHLQVQATSDYKDRAGV